MAKYAEYDENGAFNPDHTQAAQNDSLKTPGNESFEHSKNDPNKHKGSEALVEKYNIGDKAFTDSSEKDFVKTISNFNHATQNTDSENEFRSNSTEHS